MTSQISDAEALQLIEQAERERERIWAEEKREELARFEESLKQPMPWSVGLFVILFYAYVLYAVIDTVRQYINFFL
jgi:hypothetical protein